jgi:hypothetical protein
MISIAERREYNRGYMRLWRSRPENQLREMANRRKWDDQEKTAHVSESGKHAEMFRLRNWVPLDRDREAPSPSFAIYSGSGLLVRTLLKTRSST